MEHESQVTSDFKRYHLHGEQINNRIFQTALEFSVPVVCINDGPFKHYMAQFTM